MACFLSQAVRLDAKKLLLPVEATLGGEAPVLVLLAAGKGTRFGKDPKCIQPVYGTPLARHSIDSFRRVSPTPAICLVGHRHEDVAAALGKDNIYVLSENPTGGTAFAAFEAFCVPGLLEANPLLVITMGDRIVPPSVFLKLCETHQAGDEATLTFLSAEYEPPRHRGKGRVMRAADSRVERLLEEKDILAEPDEGERERLLALTEGNCPLYVIRAATLHRHLATFTNDNAQGQYYLTDIVERVSREGGEVRTVTTTPASAEYDLLCSDVTHAADLALLEGMLSTARGLLFPEQLEVDEAARLIRAGRPPAQGASIARQLREMLTVIGEERLEFDHQAPVGIGVTGGRLRIAFMHPDMARFYGPAWQMPIGAGTPAGDEQVVVLVQAAEDRAIHLFPVNWKFRETVNSLPADQDALYPGEEVADFNSYEAFGTRMAEHRLLSLGYFSDGEVEERRRQGLPAPPPAMWVSSNMRRPFALVENAIASIRTLRTGNLGARVQARLSRESFRGLRLVSTGSIPQGGFSSSSAVTVAAENAINAMWELGIPPDLLVHLACQAEYGTGVRAGSLDQATEQKGRAGQGTLMSSNPRENYRIIGTYPVPSERFRILFPYTVERDRAAWRWSHGVYGENTAEPALTTSEARKMTGKAAELAALLIRLPLDRDLFQYIEADLVADGRLELESREWIASVLRQLPLAASQQELRAAALEQRDWYVEQLLESGECADKAAARQRAETLLESLFAGWRTPPGGVPLRAMVAYLFGEVAKNFHLIHHPEEWIACVTRSQRGDCSFTIDPARLPARAEMETELVWERPVAGAERLSRWLEWVGAVPFDFNAGLDDASLAALPEFDRLEGSSFFRGLALIDLAEAMLKRAFGESAVAVRVNAAGQGDFFQVHVDVSQADPADVKRFLDLAFYRRFALRAQPRYVEVHPGGGASGVRLSRFDAVAQLVRRLEPATV